jgi:beta-galactosidase
MPDANVPGYYKGTIEKPGDGDFFLYMGDWGKGHVWINGHHIGRFWSDGPQQALYVPACWLNNGSNEIIVLDWIGPEKTIVKGLDYEIM